VSERGDVHNRYCCEKLKKIFHFEDLEVERETQHLDTGFSTSTHVFPPRHTFSHLDTGFPTSTQVFPPRHGFSQLDTGFPTSTQVSPPRHRFLHLDTGFPTSTQVSPLQHRFFFVSLCLKANAEMVPKIPSCHYMLLM